MNHAPDSHLWCEVLFRAVEDGLTGVHDVKTIEEKIHFTRIARLWLSRPSKDFNMVVTMAGLDPVAVREALDRQLATAAPIEELFNGRKKYRGQLAPMQRIPVKDKPTSKPALIQNGAFYA